MWGCTEKTIDYQPPLSLKSTRVTDVIKTRNEEKVKRKRKVARIKTIEKKCNGVSRKAYWGERDGTSELTSAVVRCRGEPVSA